jgi:hypothetical protein
MSHKVAKKSDKILLEILPMKEYQRQADASHDKAVEEWHKDERTFYPPIAFYKFYTPQGNERKTGFVARYKYKGGIGMGSQVFKTKKEALKKFGV